MAERPFRIGQTHYQGTYQSVKHLISVEGFYPFTSRYKEIYLLPTSEAKYSYHLYRQQFEHVRTLREAAQKSNQNISTDMQIVLNKPELAPHPFSPRTYNATEFLVYVGIPWTLFAAFLIIKPRTKPHSS